MYRVNHIMRTINEMRLYTPHMKANKMMDRLSKLQKISFRISIISFLLLAIIALTYGPFDTKSNLSFISALILYFVNITACVTCLSVPIIGIVRHTYDFKEEVVNELIYGIDRDEQHIEALMPYSLEELTYVANCIHVRISKIKSKCSFFGGEKTAIISILFLSYFAIEVINEANTVGLFFLSSWDKLIAVTLVFILYASLMTMFFKQKLAYLQDIKTLIDMSIKIKNNFMS